MSTALDVGKGNQIIRAAMGLFATQGARATTMPEIAAAAGVAVGTLYRYFATKEALVNATFRAGKAVLGEALRRGLGQPGPFAARFASAWAALAEVAVQEPLVFRFLELHDHGEGLDAESQALDAAVMAPAVAAFADGVASGLLRPLAPEVHIALVWGALIGLVKLGVPLDPQTVNDTGAALLAGALRPHDEPAARSRQSQDGGKS